MTQRERERVRDNRGVSADLTQVGLDVETVWGMPTNHANKSAYRGVPVDLPHKEHCAGTVLQNCSWMVVWGNVFKE